MIIETSRSRASHRRVPGDKGPRGWLAGLIVAVMGFGALALFGWYGVY